MVEATNAAGAIVAKLGEHPLAIARAGTYILATKLSFESYLERLETAGARFLSEPSQGGLPANPFSSWETLLDTLTSDAAYLLRLLAFLGNEDISEELLVVGGSARMASPTRVTSPSVSLFIRQHHLLRLMFVRGGKQAPIRRIIPYTLVGGWVDLSEPPLGALSTMESIKRAGSSIFQPVSAS